MIRRPPTAVPLRPEDITAFTEQIRAKKDAAASNPDASTASTAQATKAAQQFPEKESQAGVNMVEKKKQARQGMGVGERLGL